MGNFLCRKKSINTIEQMENQAALRKKITEIKAKGLPKQEEAKQIQALFYSKPSQEKVDEEKLLSEVLEFNEKAKNKVFNDEAATVPGCKHYQVIF